MKAIADTPHLLTVEEYARRPDAECTELVRGKVVRVSPTSFVHGWVQMQVGYLIEAHNRLHKLGRVTVESGVIVELGPGTVRGPDVAYWSFETLPANHTPAVFSDVAPDLVAEVVSPTNTRKHVATKVREYLQAGTRLVWVVEPEDRTVTIYTEPGNGTVLWDDAVLTATEILPGFSVPVRDFFPEPTPESP